MQVARRIVGLDLGFVNPLNLRNCCWPVAPHPAQVRPSRPAAPLPRLKEHPLALPATLHTFVIQLADVDRGVYETLELRLARHPSETGRYLWTRLLAYLLEYEEGIAFSKGGLSSTEEPPISIRDATGLLTSWIEVGVPSADRLHRASKAAKRVALYSSADLTVLAKECVARGVHKLADLAVWPVEPAMLAQLEEGLGRHTAVELTRSDGRIYLSANGVHFDVALAETRLV